MVAWSSSIESWVNGAFASLPLVLAHLVVPPLSALTGRDHSPELNEIYNALWPAKWLRWTFMSKYLFRSNSWEQNSLACWFTSLFIHSDYEHLFNNLIALVSEFSSVSGQIGPALTYAVFFGGGVISNFPSPVHDAQASLVGKDLKATVDKYTESWAIPKQIDGIVAKGTDLVGRVLTPSLSCGSSGAIFALTGVRFVVNLKTAWKRFEKALSTRSTKDMLLAVSYFAMNTVFPAAATYACIKGEIKGLFGGGEAKPLSTIVFGQRIGHAAHLQGAIFGMIVGVFV